ncbi:MAG: nucleotidyl transferase AbiEii/AbiGii toxin family protein [Chloroflexi bacterium]|nr:nucleotidyl transferase AbiEii/AbiGii toxin family protein [Chloroflexota bacterium]
MPASVHQRLLNKARTEGRPFQELLQYFFMERFLYRLSLSSYSDRFVLKGALMLQVYDRASTRPTMDIDLEGIIGNSIQEITNAVRKISKIEVEPDDGIKFDTDSIRAEQITEDAEYEGIRVRFTGALGKATRSMQIDIGFGDVIVPAPIDVELTPILDFPAPRLLGYPKETKVAEKFHAMVQLGEINSRMKDFYDIWLLSRKQEFDGNILFRAIHEKFIQRELNLETHPVAFSDGFGNDPARQQMWSAFLKKSSLHDAPEDFLEVIVWIRQFLGPVSVAAARGEDFGRTWPPGGPWE